MFFHSLKELLVELHGSSQDTVTTAIVTDVRRWSTDEVKGKEVYVL